MGRFLGKESTMLSALPAENVLCSKLTRFMCLMCCVCVCSKSALRCRLPQAVEASGAKVLRGEQMEKRGGGIPTGGVMTSQRHGQWLRRSFAKGNWDEIGLHFGLQTNFTAISPLFHC